MRLLISEETGGWRRERTLVVTAEAAGEFLITRQQRCSVGSKTHQMNPAMQKSSEQVRDSIALIKAINHDDTSRL